MKHNHNSHSGFDLPLFILFNELVWLAVVGVVLIAALQLAKGKQWRSNSQDLRHWSETTLQKLLEEKDALEERLQSREQELELALAKKHKLQDQLNKTKQKLDLEKQLQNQPERTEQVVRKELLGLKGKLE